MRAHYDTLELELVTPASTSQMVGFQAVCYHALLGVGYLFMCVSWGNVEIVQLLHFLFVVL